jgi:23S rRNA pseudouridine1911/1915/1917 synthase
MDILYEDNHLIVVNKPFGMGSQGDETRDESVVDWVKSYLKRTYDKPGNVYLGLIHRLDRPAGGIMVLAKTSKAASRLSKQFQSKSVEKIYVALTERVPAQSQGSLTHHLAKLPGRNIVRAHPKPVADSKQARLHYQVLHTHAGRALVEVQLETGRRHQIRVQLATLGCTIKGDVKYGQTSFNSDQSICLMARRLTFDHPTLDKSMTIELPLPEGPIWRPFDKLDRTATKIKQPRVIWR